MHFELSCHWNANVFLSVHMNREEKNCGERNGRKKNSKQNKLKQRNNNTQTFHWCIQKICVVCKHFSDFSHRTYSSERASERAFTYWINTKPSDSIWNSFFLFFLLLFVLCALFSVSCKCYYSIIFFLVRLLDRSLAGWWLGLYHLSFAVYPNWLSFVAYEIEESINWQKKA